MIEVQLCLSGISLDGSKKYLNVESIKVFPVVVGIASFLGYAADLKKKDGNVITDVER